MTCGCITCLAAALSDLSSRVPPVEWGSITIGTSPRSLWVAHGDLSAEDAIGVTAAALAVLLRRYAMDQAAVSERLPGWLIGPSDQSDAINRKNQSAAKRGML